MRKCPVVYMLAISIFSAVFSSSVLAERTNDFGRKHLFIGSDPAVMKLMAAVADHVEEKSLKGKPKIKLEYALGAMKTLCRGNKAAFPDMIATIREMTAEEFKRCQNNDVGSIIKLKIGYEALVVASDKKSMDLNLNEKKLFLALAADVPNDKSEYKGILMENPYTTWNDVDPDAPKQAIKIFAPAHHSRNERTVKMLGMEPGCRTWGWISEMKHVQKSHRLYRQICRVPRKDGVYIKAESAGADLTKKLLSNKNSIGLIDFNRWMKSKDKLKAYSISELPPTIGTISKGLYPLSRAYYVYIKVSSLKKVQGASHFLNELVSDDALKAKGYLASIGLVAMPDKERQREVEQASELVAMTAPDPS